MTTTFTIETPVLHTQRLTLRPLTESDIEAVQREFARWSIIQHLSIHVPWPYPSDGAHHWFHHSIRPDVERKRAAVWAITHPPSSDALIGIVHIMQDDGLGHRGFWLAEAHHGRGYMTEAVERVNDHVFSTTTLDEMFVYNAASNVASRRIKEKTGAEFVGMVDAAHRSGETQTEVWVYRRTAWMQRSPKRPRSQELTE